ncbi:Transglutaminase-like [Pseudoalteromonas luteoviolacea B = ATCC 29581]|nr:Transglutaminase-like [Pseudoalteromonas luteoviolacea B = ATCC 29581]
MTRPIDTTFRLRGESMDRLETFVAASFAFAVTMLIISIDDIPTNFTEFLQAVKLVPSFAASFAIIAWIWASHAAWCRKYGLEDAPTILLSCTLVFVVLIYIFPLRIMMQGLFAALSDGYLPSEMKYDNIFEVRFMFVFYSVGFWALSANFFALFAYANRQKERLNLTCFEQYQTQTEQQSWAIVNLIALSSIVLSIYLPSHLIGWAGYVYFLLFPILIAHGMLRK